MTSYDLPNILVQLILLIAYLFTLSTLLSSGAFIWPVPIAFQLLAFILAIILPSGALRSRILYGCIGCIVFLASFALVNPYNPEAAGMLCMVAFICGILINVALYDLLHDTKPLKNISLLFNFFMPLVIALSYTQVYKIIFETFRIMAILGSFFIIALIVRELRGLIRW